MRLRRHVRRRWSHVIAHRSIRRSRDVQMVEGVRSGRSPPSDRHPNGAILWKEWHETRTKYKRWKHKWYWKDRVMQHGSRQIN